MRNKNMFHAKVFDIAAKFFGPFFMTSTFRFNQELLRDSRAALVKFWTLENFARPGLLSERVGLF